MLSSVPQEFIRTKVCLIPPKEKQMILKKRYKWMLDLLKNMVERIP
jgi:hypothetical protein